MNAPELFPVTQSLSPKLKWMKENCVITYRFPDGEWLAGHAPMRPGRISIDEWFLAETSEWNDTRIGAGDSEEEAIIDLCQKRGIKHYSIS